jgi:hypothetical protein
MYEAGDQAVKEDIIQLAAAKLLNSDSDQVDIEQLSNDHAYLIDFQSSSTRERTSIMTTNKDK